MESLYVCLFSNGHIKVGRSIDPTSRIATHAERVSCVGIALADKFMTYPVKSAERREAMLIALCAEAPGAQRFKNEWFTGLEFSEVCGWTSHVAHLELSETELQQDGFGSRLRAARIAKGLTQAQLAVGLAFTGGDLGKAAISTWERDEHSPSVTQLRLMCERLDVSADELLGIRQVA